MTWAEFEIANVEQRRIIAREWIAQWEENYRRQCQLDAEADQRAFRRGTIDAPAGSIDEIGQHGNAGTNRTPSLR